MTLHYKGFTVLGASYNGGGIGHYPYGPELTVRDLRNKEYLDGRRSVMREEPFFFSTLETAKRAIERYQELHPNDPIFHGRWRNSPEMEAVNENG